LQSPQTASSAPLFTAAIGEIAGTIHSCSMWPIFRLPFCAVAMTRMRAPVSCDGPSYRSTLRYPIGR
jgi:hypothetical protein